MTPEIAAKIYAIAMIPPVVLQIALIFGAPWGHLTMGGKFPGVLPLRVRWIAALQIAVQVTMTLVVWQTAGLPLLAISNLTFPDWAIWIVLALTVLSCIGNWATPSRMERYLWGPTTLVLLGCVIGVIVL